MASSNAFAAAAAVLAVLSAYVRLQLHDDTSPGGCSGSVPVKLPPPPPPQGTACPPSHTGALPELAGQTFCITMLYGGYLHTLVRCKYAVLGCARLGRV